MAKASKQIRDRREQCSGEGGSGEPLVTSQSDVRGGRRSPDAWFPALRDAVFLVALRFAVVFFAVFLAALRVPVAFFAGIAGVGLSVDSCSVDASSGES